MRPIVALKRRELLIGAAAAAAMPPWRALAADAARLTTTPGQTEGPFYPVTLPADMDNDLVRLQGHAAQALGQVTYLAGRVLDKRGAPVRGAMLEIWQCDANGIYNHPRQAGLQRRDAAFQGYGRAQAADDGR